MSNEFFEKSVDSSKDRATLAAEISCQDFEDLNNRLSEWKFFLLPVPLVTRILRLSEEIGDHYFDKEYDEIVHREDLASAYPSELNPEPGWLKRLFSDISGMLFHQEEDVESRKSLSEEEWIRFFQKVMSEKIFAHLAMLSRSPHAKKGGSFSIQEELTVEIAEKLGLGPCLHADTPTRLREDCLITLMDLAYEFQRWLVAEQDGIYATIWGGLCSSEKEEVARESDLSPLLVLQPDVQKKVLAATETAAQTETAGAA